MDTKASAPDHPPPPAYSPYPVPGASGEPGYPQQPPYPQQHPYPPHAQPQPFHPQQPYPQLYPGQVGYPQAPPNVTHITQPTIVVRSPVLTTHASGFREIPMTTVCPGCGASITTHIEFTSGTLTWIICFLIAIFGFFIGCCLIPFCINSCKDVVHTCPSCHCVVAKYNRI